MRLAYAHARAMTLELLRYPAYLVPTLALPPVFFLFFSPPGGHLDAGARMATFAGFAVIGVAFFQFGVGIAIDRAAPWESYLRTLPLGPAVRLGSRLLSATLFASVAGALVMVTAVATTTVELPATRWAALVMALLIGGVPFALLGIALGYWAPAKGALPIANLLYLALSYAGGLWIRPDGLPHTVRLLSPYLPTRALSDSAVACVVGTYPSGRSGGALLVFTLLFGLAAAAGYRRDEGRRFS